MNSLGLEGAEVADPPLGVEGAEVADPPSSIRSLPLDRRAEPLAALALRIHQLPYGDRFEMNRQFLNAFNEIPERNRTLNLTALANVAAYSADRFVDPRTAAYRGAHLGHTARFYNIQDQQVIHKMEQASATSLTTGSAAQRVRNGENAQTVANELGFTTQDGINRLEMTAAMSRKPGSAGQRVRDGEDVLTVATQLGIVSPAAISILESKATHSRQRRSAG
jgi:hypothetical protein